MPRFSILVPVYNALPHLNDALASILNQTLSDYEVVLVDDGSTDGSAGVAMPLRPLVTTRQWFIRKTPAFCSRVAWRWAAHRGITS